MSRKSYPCDLKIDDKLQFSHSEPLQDWLRQQAKVESWLLAHAIDGVIWGRVNESHLVTSHEVAATVSPPLRLETLQQLRLFNPAYEVRLWRDQTTDQWWTRKIEEGSPAALKVEAFDEQQLLWGTYATSLSDGFVLLEDGAQGLRHVIPPFPGSEQLNGELGARTDEAIRRVHLKVRHYLTEDALGVNLVTMSRLTGMGIEHYG